MVKKKVAKKTKTSLKSHREDMSNRVVLVLICLVILASAMSIVAFIGANGDTGSARGDALIGEAVHLEELAKQLAEEELEHIKENLERGQE